nr:hypothetical protein [Streptomyces sp. NBC_00287]
MSSERLAVKLIDYARLFTYEPPPAGRRRPVSPGPAWLRHYPVFPRVLFVLTGASPTRLAHRISDLKAMVIQHPSSPPSPAKPPRSSGPGRHRRDGTHPPRMDTLTTGPPQSWTAL